MSESIFGMDRTEPIAVSTCPICAKTTARFTCATDGYLLPTTNANGEQIYFYSSKSGAAINTEIGFDRFLKIRVKRTSNWLKINTYAFADAGVLAYGNFSKQLSPVRIDAGLGSTVTIKKWWVLEKTPPLIVRFDFPFFLNTPPFDEAKYIKFRWLISVERAF